MSWCLRFLSYEVHTLWAWRDAEFWVHFNAFHLLCHWDVCWQPKRVEAPLQFSLGAFKVYFVFVLYSRLAAVIFLLSFWYYYWPWVHFLTLTGWSLFVAIPFPHHISCLERDPTASVSVPPVERGTLTQQPRFPLVTGEHPLWPKQDSAAQGPRRWALEV